MTPGEWAGVAGLTVAALGLAERVHARLTQPPDGHGVPDLRRRVEVLETDQGKLEVDVRRIEHEGAANTQTILLGISEARAETRILAAGIGASKR